MAASLVKNLKILIVEDDEISEMLISRVVKIFSRELIRVSTGVEAVKACQDHPDIDLIIMDIQMPEMDGYEATRRIRQFNTEIIIFAHTASGQIDGKEKAYVSGFNDHIAKPINIAALKALMLKHFKRS